MPPKKGDAKKIVERIERLELSIDANLLDLRNEMFTLPEEQWDVVATFMRAAYGKGITDAVKDPRGMKQWISEHGYKLP